MAAAVDGATTTGPAAVAPQPVTSKHQRQNRANDFTVLTASSVGRWVTWSESLLACDVAAGKRRDPLWQSVIADVPRGRNNGCSHGVPAPLIIRARSRAAYACQPPRTGLAPFVPGVPHARRPAEGPARARAVAVCRCA